MLQVHRDLSFNLKASDLYWRTEPVVIWWADICGWSACL